MLLDKMSNLQPFKFKICVFLLFSLTNKGYVKIGPAPSDFIVLKQFKKCFQCFQDQEQNLRRKPKGFEKIAQLPPSYQYWMPYLPILMHAKQNFAQQKHT